MSSLREQTQGLYEEYQRTVPKEIMNVIDQATDNLVASSIGQSCLQKGGKVKDFTLPDAYGNHVTLSELLKQGPVILSFYRGGWCTFCNLELKALQDRLEDIHKAGAQLVAITPQQPDGTRETLEELGIEYPILTDQSNRVAKTMGLVFEVADELKSIYKNEFGLDIPAANNDASYELPVTATYVVNQEQIIEAAFTDPNFVNRFEPEDILAAISSLNEEEVMV